jgi:glutaminase
MFDRVTAKQFAMMGQLANGGVNFHRQKDIARYSIMMLILQRVGQWAFTADFPTAGVGGGIVA